MKKKRIFIGSFLQPNNFEKKYQKLQKEFKNSIVGRWTPLQNLHITYKFIGNVDETELKNIYQQLKQEINSQREININLNGLGAFPSIYNPKILYIKAEEQNDHLTAIHNTIEQKLKYIGIPENEKKFIPHITLMRIKKYKIENFLKTIHNYQNYNFGTIKEIEINIIESILTPKGAVYRKIDIR